MSSIYVHEPATNGKVLLLTNFGELEIEFWSKEAPLAVRNFVQLCLEGYYENTKFFRVVKGYIVQGGDPSNDGTGGESIYGKPFKDEFHSRLKFVRRGLVAMCNSGPNDNGSQFFITLGACVNLQNKHTIFGKVSSDTIYNLLKLESIETGDDDVPLETYEILTAKVIVNPFPDIAPRKPQTSDSSSDIEDVTPVPATKNLNLLSFGEEAEEDDDILELYVDENLRGKGKSSHDLAPGESLSSVSSASLYDKEALDPLKSIKEKLRAPEATVSVAPDSQVVQDNNSASGKLSVGDQLKLAREQVRELKRKLKNGGKKEQESLNQAKELAATTNESSNAMLIEYREDLEKFKKKKEMIPADTKLRQKKTLEMLETFTKKIKAAKEDKNTISEKVTVDPKSAKDGNTTDIDEDKDWMTPNLNFDETSVVARDANAENPDTFDITDPRNPIVLRRSSRKRTRK